MKKILLPLIMVAALLTVGSSHASVSAKTCWQAKLTFLNFPSTPDSFARWRMVQGGKVRGERLIGGQAFAKGEFSFHGDAGGGYQRIIKRCTSVVDPWAKNVHVTLDWATYVDCKNCKSLAAIRRAS